MKRLWLIASVLLPLACPASVQTIMMLRLGEDGGGGERFRCLDSSGLKNDTGDAVNRPAHLSLSTNTAPLAQSSVCYKFSGNDGIFGAAACYPWPWTNYGMEAWVRVADLTQTNRLIAGSTDTGLLLSFDAALGLFASANNGTRLTTAYMPSSTNEWVNCAVVNVAEDIRFYVNGALLSSSNISAVRPNFWSPYFKWNLGVNNDQVAGFKGWIDEYRMFSFIAGQFCTNDLLYNVAQGKPGFAGIPTWNTVCQDGTNVMVVAGDTLNLLCTTKGAAPISYFWETNGVLASTNQVLSFTNATVGLSGSYILVASNSFGATTSAAVQVNVRSLIVPTQGTTPNTGQALMMSRKYGMFMHYGPQTFDLLANQYGLVENYHYSPPSISIYRPTQLDPAQWIDTAWNAGFRYVVLVAKHSSGFCLWPTATTRYNVAYSPVTNDVVGAVAAASANRGLGFGVYFSLWDQTFYGETTGPMYGRPYDSGYFNVITNQLTELMSNYGPICEVWFDGQWVASRNPYFWHAAEIYDLVKRLQPNCSVNWNWGVTKLNNLPTSTGLIYSATPAQMADGDPIEFWPSDGRTADPVLPANPDPKQFSNPNIAGSSYYMPFEAPMTIQNNGAWFWHFETGDVGTMAPSFIAAYYTYCIAQNDAFLLNVPPNTNGVISTAYSNALMSAAAAIGITPVLVPAAISGPLTNQTIECGSNITIAVTASGTHPLRIQWSFDGTPIPGATNSSLSLTNIHLPDHTVTLVVTNLYGSLASNVVLTVHDTIAPRITLNGSNPLIIELGAGFTDPGATADDTCASSVSVVASGAVNTDAVGTNTVVYTADDGNGNTNTALRTVIVRDTTPPTILWSFTNLVLMADTNCGALMPDVTGTNYILATDLSGPLTITQIPTNQAPLLLGTNLVVITVSDAYNNAADSTNAVIVRNQEPPVITLNGSNPLFTELGAGFTDPGATADDTCASSVSVIASGAVNTDAVGTNTVVYTADDGNGNTNTALRTVIVRDTTPPAILWSFTNLVLMADTNCGALMPDVIGTNYILATDLSGPLTITQIPTNQAPLLLGTNLVVITVSDAYNNAADSTNAVIVRNQTLPVITLNGSNPLFIELGAGFTDPGATADDTCVGSVSVIASGAVNTDAVGTNSVVYTADDGNGNTNTALRTVIVRDTTPPAILWSFTNLVLMADTNCGALMPDVTGTNYILATDLSGPLTITQIPTNQAPLLLGTNLVVITVSDAYNNAADSTNAIVSQDQSPPVILSQPQSRTNLVGATADFSVSASSCTPLAYQWFFNGGVLTNQTNNTLMIVSTGPANAGDYTALVTASGGSTTSAVATLTVSATPIITSVDGNPDGSFSLNLAGGAGCTYVFETTTNLDSLGIWLPVATNTVGSNGLWQFNDAQATNFSQRFYRSKLVP